MARYFNIWKSPAESFPTPSHTGQTSQFLHNTNEMFKLFLNNGSWFVYFIAGFLVLCCIYFYISDCKRRMELRRRRQEIQRANERVFSNKLQQKQRLPQRRRPGAVYRDREIFRNVIKTVRQYMKSREEQKPNTTSKSDFIRRTRSGVIYGRFSSENNNYPVIDAN